MVLKSRKFKISVSSILPCDAEGLFKQMSRKHAMKYIGVYTSLEDSIVVYANFKNALDSERIRVFMKSIDVEVGNIASYKEFEGELQSEHGTLYSIGRPAKRSRQSSPTGPQTIINNTQNIDNSVNTSNNINLIIVNPIGMESLDHITPEFIQKLLSDDHGPDVVFKFGTKMYSLQENMNFKTDLKSGYISGRLQQDGAWETHRKSEGFGMLMDNLKNKNEEAVLKHMESLPYEDLLKFERDMGWIHEHKWSGLQEDVPVYNKFVREGFNLLSANIADKARRIERDTGKKLKLV